MTKPFRSASKAVNTSVVFNSILVLHSRLPINGFQFKFRQDEKIRFCRTLLAEFGNHR